MTEREYGVLDRHGSKLVFAKQGGNAVLVYDPEHGQGFYDEELSDSEVSGMAAELGGYLSREESELEVDWSNLKPDNSKLYRLANLLDDDPRAVEDAYSPKSHAIRDQSHPDT